MSVVVCVCTYRRPLQLSRLLDSLSRIVRHPSTTFLVADNDGSDLDIERRVNEFRRTSGARVEYVIERTPGIAAARNAAFATAASLGADVVAMLDDDEWASPDWLTKLLQARENSGAAIVGGPVHPVFATSRPELAGYEWLWSIRKDYRDGRIYVSCTCNCLIDVSAVVSILGSRPFPVEFGLTGGEDAVFFRRLHNAGIKMTWAEEALLFEEVPDERARFAWIGQRWYRQGNVGVACERAARAPGQLSPWLKSMLLFGRLPVYPLFQRAAFGLPRLWLLEYERLRGRLAAHLGVAFEEYARP